MISRALLRLPQAAPSAAPCRFVQATFFGDFVRALTRAGLPFDQGALRDTDEAIAIVDERARDDLYWALHAVFVKRHEHSTVFRHAFNVVWPAQNADRPTATISSIARPPQASERVKPSPRPTGEWGSPD